MSLKPRIRVMLAAAIWLAALTVAPALPANSQLFVERAQKAFDLAQKNYLADTNSAAAARVLARASVDVADLATNNY